MHQVDTIETHVKLGLYLLGNAALSTNSATRSRPPLATTPDQSVTTG